MDERLKDLTLFESTHRYFYKGRELTAVTFALERCGITDFSKVPFDFLERARIVGDTAHQIAKFYALDDLHEDSVDSVMAGYYEAIKKFFAAEVNYVLHVEPKVMSLHFGYAGQPDLLYVNHKNRTCLTDYKTGGKNDAPAQLQTAAYKRAFEKNYNQKIQERNAIYLDPSGEYQKEKFRNHNEDFNAFVHALAVCQWKEANHIST